MQPANPSPNAYIFNKSSRKFAAGKRASLANWFKTFIYTLLCLIGAGVFGYVLGVEEYLLQMRVDRDSKTTVATVTDGYQRTQDLIFVSYTLTYDYQVDGRQYSRTHGVSSDFWDQIRIGDTVHVRYSKTNPAESYIEGESILGAARIVGALLWMIAPAVLLLLAAFLIANEWYRDQMSRTGQILTARLGSMTVASVYRGSVTYNVEFDFATPSGARIMGKRSVSMRKDRRRVLPPPGTPVLVLYKDDKNYLLL